MLKKMLVLAFLVPGVAGCVSRDNPGPVPRESELQEQILECRQTEEQDPEHSHGAGCGHALRGCELIDQY